MTKTIQKFKFDEKLIEKTSRICKAMSEPIRLRILGELGVHKQGNCESVGELAKTLEKDQSVIYRHVQILEKAGLLRTSKKGSTLFSCTTTNAREIINFFRKQE